MGGEHLLALIAAIFTVGAYWRTNDKDPGVTSEVALVLTVLPGGLAQTQIATACAFAVVVTIVLAARVRLQYFVAHVVSESELKDALVFAAATLVVLPLMPDCYIGPFGAINLRIVWKIVIVIMSISAGGYLAVQLLGSRLGLPIAGLASGFVSSTATIGAMAAQAAQEPALATSATASAFCLRSHAFALHQLYDVIAEHSESTQTPLRKE